MNYVVHKKSDKQDNMGSNIYSDGTVDKHVNNKNYVQNQAGTLNYSSTTAIEYSVGISHPLITPMINNVTTSKVPSRKYTCWWK